MTKRELAVTKRPFNCYVNLINNQKIKMADKIKKHGGRRPGAGRKSLGEEAKRLRDIVRCWDVVMEFVNSEAPLKDRAEMAARIAVKAIPEQHQHSGDLIIRYGHRNDK